MNVIRLKEVHKNYKVQRKMEHLLQSYMPLKIQIGFQIEREDLNLMKLKETCEVSSCILIPFGW